MLPSRVAGGIAQSSSSSGISFQGDGHSKVVGNSNFGNSINTVPGHVPGNICQDTVLNSVTSSGPNVGASSLVTDANSGLSGGPHVQRSASINTESYTRLPASPLSFSSNNIGMSCSSVLDVSSVVQQNSYQDHGSQQAHQNHQLQGNSTATSLLQMGQVNLPSGRRLPNSYFQETAALSQLQKKPRLDIKQEDVLQPQVLQQLSSRQDPVNLQIPNQQLQALIQQQRQRQQEQQFLQAMNPFQRAQLLQQQQQLQLRPQFQIQGMSQPSTYAIKRPYEGGVCSRRLMQYLYHKRQRPVENSIAYWRKFVAEYYSPRAKRRWCLSLYNSVGHHSLGAFPQASMDSWQCDICRSKSGRGFEATFEVLPRLNEIEFSSGVIDELLFLDLPREYRFPSGIMILEYAKAVQESVYEQLRVVREGRLRIIFTPELKILSWEFCARSHEELLPCRVVAPQVNQLLQIAQKCQNSISEGGIGGVPQQDLQANSALVISAGRQLAKSLELQSLNDLGFSKRYVRCLQIADVVDSMKPLMDFCGEQKKGPIEGLKTFPRCVVNAPDAALQNPPEANQIGGHQAMPTDPNQIREQMAYARANMNQQAGFRGTLNGSAQTAFALNNYQNLVMRQNSVTPREAASVSPFGTNTGILLQKPAMGGGFSASQTPNQLQFPAQQEQLMIQQLLQHDMTKKNAVLPQQNILTCIGNAGNADFEQPSSRSNSLCRGGSSNGESLSGGFGQKAVSENVHSLSEYLPDMCDEFAENGLFFNSDLNGDNISFSWKN